MIKGDNIYLRAMELSDCDILYEIENNDETWRHGSYRAPYSKHIILNLIKRSIKYDIYTEKQLRLIICSNKTKEVIGYVDLYNFDPNNKRSAIGIYILSKHQRLGYAKEALDLIIDYCFNVLLLKQVYSEILENNIISIELFKSKGFTECAFHKCWLNINGKWENQYTFQLINKNII
ncbi:MAG: GNAT family N-acetyltransferase [Bacteroidales bacterium]|jgi:diamine N-acetyltransferase